MRRIIDLTVVRQACKPWVPKSTTTNRCNRREIRHTNVPVVIQSQTCYSRMECGTCLQPCTCVLSKATESGAILGATGHARSVGGQLLELRCSCHCASRDVTRSTKAPTRWNDRSLVIRSALRSTHNQSRLRDCDCGGEKLQGCSYNYACSCDIQRAQSRRQRRSQPWAWSQPLLLRSCDVQHPAQMQLQRPRSPLQTHHTSVAHAPSN